MSENKFNWNFDEAETNERLIALSLAQDMLFEKRAPDVMNGTIGVMEFVRMDNALNDVKKQLTEYAEDKGYDVTEHSERHKELFNERWHTPLYKEYNKFFFQYLHDDRLAHQRNVSKNDKEECTVIDESQFEVPDQNQKTL